MPLILASINIGMGSVFKDIDVLFTLTGLESSLLTADFLNAMKCILGTS